MRRTAKRISTGIGVAALAMLLAGIAFQGGLVHAQGPGGPGGRGFGGPGRGPGPGGPMGMLNPMMLERLGLTDQQRDQVKQIIDAQKEDQKALGDRSMKAHQALEAAINNENFNEGAIRGLSAEVASVEADLAVARGRVYGQVFQILTPDQQTQLKQMQARMLEREQNRGQGRGPKQH